MPLVIHGAESHPHDGPGPVLTIGNFDGVHLGHQHLLRRLVEVARGAGAPSAVLTFDPAPRDVLRPDNDVPRIQALEDRIEALGAVGVDRVIVHPFTRDLASLEPRQFSDRFLAGHLRVSGLVLGWDFRFGARRAGTPADLRAFLPVPVEQVEALHVGDAVASSSRIRDLVREGHVAEAARLLTRPHRLRGPVVPGDQRGRNLGFPTANVAVETPLRPAHGVYAVRVQVDGVTRDGVANYGRRPTFGGGAPLLEVHLLDFEGDLYGRPLAVDLVERIRGERKFDGLDALVRQITADRDAARALLTP